MKVSELQGALLDYWVARAEGDRCRIQRVTCGPCDDAGNITQYWVNEDRCLRVYTSFDGTEKGGFHLGYSTLWQLAGPIIEREAIDIICTEPSLEPRFWLADASQIGETPLIAAMRAHVARTFGQEVSEE